jgi:two-component system KDP operon response regulator KdpE
MKRVLVIDDEPQIQRLLEFTLAPRGYEVFVAGTGFEGLQAIPSVRPDIILLDLGLPDRDGGTVLVELRTWSSIPLIVLSVRDRESDIVQLLDAGADDYLTKPFRTEELLARMKAALRRFRGEQGEPTYVAGDLVVDFEERRLRLGGQELRLTPTEYAIVAELARAGGRIVTSDRLRRELWGPVADEEKGSLRVHVASLRKKLEQDTTRPVHLLTEPGIGYRLR